MKRSSSTTAIHYDGYLWDQAGTPLPEEILQSAANKALLEIPLPKKAKMVPVFYPYTELKSTIKLRNGHFILRISDILEGAPQEILCTLIKILLAKITGKRCDPAWNLQYNTYIQSAEIEKKHGEVRRNRIQKHILSPVGKYHDLRKIFAKNNRHYFQSKLEKPTLSWTERKSRSRLGYHDSHLNLIMISRWLDRKQVPAYLVEYIMYHEMLHMVIPSETKNGKRYIHTPQFQKKEREFAYYEEAKRWLAR